VWVAGRGYRIGVGSVEVMVESAWWEEARWLEWLDVYAVMPH